jgi:hypothetical protein
MMLQRYLLIVALLLSSSAVFAQSQAAAISPETSAARTVFGVPIPTSPIPPGTVITMQNWQQYSQYMSDGLQAFFKGTYHWQFPHDFRMEIGPTKHYLPASPEYMQATEKYASQVRIVNLPDGAHTITGYVAGLPFPNAQEPLRGWKLLVDIWYSYVPYLICGYDSFYEIDRFGNMFTEKGTQIYRQLGHVADYGQPTENPDAPGLYYSQYIEITAPEQVRYLTNLQLYYMDVSKPIDIFLFIPALRRSLRLSSAARCSPFAGTDFAQDDTNKSNFNGDWRLFDGKVVRETFTFELPEVSSLQNLGNLDNFYKPIYFPKPIIGKWQVRPVWVDEVSRIRSYASGYCYGKKVFWLDKESYLANWIDSYDSNLKLWKIALSTGLASNTPHIGVTQNGDQWFNPLWDIQGAHLSLGMATDPEGNKYKWMEDCGNYEGQNLDDVAKYSTSAGLSQIMR